jgi:hypothetical protein
VSQGGTKKPKEDPASLGTFAGLFQRNRDELAELRAKQRPVNLTEVPRRAEPLPAPDRPAKVISAEEAMRLAFEEATDARSRKFLSEGMKLGNVAVEGDRPAAGQRGPQQALGADYDFEREVMGTTPLRPNRPKR